MSQPDLQLQCDPQSGMVRSLTLFGHELLDPAHPGPSDLLVNGRPLKTRLAPRADKPAKPEDAARLQGEQWVNHFTGYGLLLTRDMGLRQNAQHPCFGINYTVRRDPAAATDLPCPGPGGPAVEAPLYVDTFTTMNWNWQFWGDDTRMLFPSSHSSGPADEFGHIGYEHDTPERCKAFIQNVWRRIYPGVLVIHGGLYYNAKTGHWIAITCRRPNLGYILNLDTAGRGLAYDYTLHTAFAPNDFVRLPEVKIYYGRTPAEMWQWLADYVTFYYEEPPRWVFQTLFGEGLAWTNQPTWRAQAKHWHAELDKGTHNGINYCLVTNRPVRSGTSPLGYEPDPNHGTISEFREMCLSLKRRGVPVLTWMSHTGLLPGAPDVDDDWFIRGVDGKIAGSWGDEGMAMYFVNPGHPGYIEYTKKWIRFYLKECGVKGIFFDCLGFALPADFRPRAFMRYPGDVGVMVIRFIEEMYACIKECDPEAIMLGEGTTLDGPCHIFSSNTNPVRAIDGLGPRDFFLHLNQYSEKRMVIDQGPTFAPGSGYTRMDGRPGADERNRLLLKLLREQGGARTWIGLPGDLSVSGDLLVVPVYEGKAPAAFRLVAPYDTVVKLTDEVTGAVHARTADGTFAGIPTGIYRLAR